MSSPRFSAVLGGTAAAPVVDIPAFDFSAEASGTLTDGAIFTLAARGAPARRQLLWVRDLDGVQIGVIS